MTRGIFASLTAAAVLSAHGRWVVGASADTIRAGFNSAITKDVVILGGGAAGAHAAVRLREDYKKSIVLVEAQPILGGQVSTYTDPTDNTPYSAGVAAFFEYGRMKEFFSFLNITLGGSGLQPLAEHFANFDNGKNQTAFVPPNPGASFQKMLDIASKYESLIQPSYAKFPPPDQIPADLLLTFSQFMTKYNLTDIIPTIFTTTGMGMGNIDDALMLYVFQAFPASVLRAFLGQVGVFVPASHRNRELYEKISALLGSDVLYSSTATSVNRTNDGVDVVVKGADGSLTTIHAKRLLVAFEPTPGNTAPLDLDSAETEVFSKFSFSTVHVGVLNKTDLPPRGAITNTPDGQVPSNYVALPHTPFVGRFEWMGGDNQHVFVTGDLGYDVGSAQALAKSTLSKLAVAGTIPSARADIAAWFNHGPMHARVSAETLQSGFIQKKYALQGRRSTFWTGAAWAAQYHTLLWEYNNQYLLPKLIESL